MYGKKMNDKKIKITQLLCAFLVFINFQSQAIETSIQLHKADEGYGYSFGLGDSFFNQKAINWRVAYNRLEDINITWNSDDIDFSLDSVEFALSYRYYPSSYDKFIRSLRVEVQVGAGVSLTETKFEWPELDEIKYFSEQGDINPFLSLSLHKELSKNTSMHIGVKHYTNYSEFDDISSVFIGVNYRFGRKVGY